MTMHKRSRSFDAVMGITNIRATMLQVGMMHYNTLSLIDKVEHSESLTTVTLRNSHVYDYDPKSIVPVMSAWME